MKTTLNLLILITIFFTVNSRAQDTSRISKIFPNSRDIEDFVTSYDITFEKLNINISDIKKGINLDQIYTKANRSYNLIMKDRDSPTLLDTVFSERKIKFQKYPKQKVIDSILVPGYISDKISSILFHEFVNKKYSKLDFMEYICSPNITASENWKIFRHKLSTFNDSILLNNFDMIKENEYLKTIDIIPIGLFLIQDDIRSDWVLILRWEYKDIQGNSYSDESNNSLKNCIRIPGIIGFVYNFNFSQFLYTFMSK